MINDYQILGDWKMGQEIKLDENNIFFTDDYFDPLDRKLLELSIPVSQIASSIIKIGSLLFLWTYTMLELVRLFEPSSRQFLLYMLISGIPPILLWRIWYWYVSLDKEKNNLNGNQS